MVDEGLLNFPDELEQDRMKLIAKGVAPEVAAAAIAGVRQGLMLISINEALSLGINRIRQRHWTDPLDHVMVHAPHGKPECWLNSPLGIALHGCDPVPIPNTVGLIVDCDEKVWVPYSGPLPDSPEYLAAQERMRERAAWLKGD